MMQSLVRWIGRRCLGWFYRECRFVGAERVPASGPVLLIGNHWNDIPDALSGYLTTSRPLHYVATILGATSPIARWVYRGLGLIPVTRIRDARKVREQGGNAAEMNQAAVRTVIERLGAGGIIGVFPEGGVHDGPHLGHFRSGVAKMALDGVLTGAICDLVLVPFGVHYDAPRSFRSDMTVVIGEPVSVDEWLANAISQERSTHQEGADTTDRIARREGAKLALAFRDRMRDALASVTRNAPTWELAASRDRVTAAVAGAICGADESVLVVASLVQADCGVLASQWHHLVDPISTAIERAGGISRSPRDAARVLGACGVSGGAPAWPSTVGTLALAPLAALGWALLGPALWFVWRQAKRTAADRTEQVARAFAPGLYLILLWHVALGALFAVGLRAVGYPVWLAIPAVMLLPRLGDLTLSWHDAMAALRLRRHVTRWPESERAPIRTAADALCAAWQSHSSGSAVKAAPHMGAEAST